MATLNVISFILSLGGALFLFIITQHLYVFFRTYSNNKLLLYKISTDELSSFMAMLGCCLKCCLQIILYCL